MSTGPTISPPAAPGRLAPIVVERTAGALSMGIVANTWHDLDTGGSAASRPLDVVIPGVRAGDWVGIDPDFSSNATAAAAYLDIFTIVAGAPVHRFGGDRSPSSVGGNGSWVAAAGTGLNVAATIWYQLDATDIENGAVRLRLRDCNVTTTARTVNAVAAVPFRMAGRGPF